MYIYSTKFQTPFSRKYYFLFFSFYIVNNVTSWNTLHNTVLFVFPAILLQFNVSRTISSSLNSPEPGCWQVEFWNSLDQNENRHPPPADIFEKRRVFPSSTCRNNHKSDPIWVTPRRRPRRNSIAFRIYSRDTFDPTDFNPIAGWNTGAKKRIGERLNETFFFTLLLESSR